MKDKQKSELLKVVGFLKENTIAITATSAILYALTYLYQVLVFKKWQIPLGIIERASSQFFFIVITGVIYSLSVSIHQLYILTKFKQVAPTYYVNGFLRKLLRKYQNTNFTDKGRTALISIVIENCKEIKKKVLHYIVASLVLSFLLFFPFYALFYIVFLDFGLSDTIVPFLMYIISTIIFLFLFASNDTRKKLGIEKKALKSKKNTDAIFDICRQLIENESARLLDQIDISIGNDSFSNFSRIIYPTIVTFLLMVVVRLVQPLPLEYWLITYDNFDYVVVYQSGQTAICKRAEIDNEHNLVILLDEQVYANTDSISLKYTRFKSVDVSTNSK